MVGQTQIPEDQVPGDQILVTIIYRNTLKPNLWPKQKHALKQWKKKIKNKKLKELVAAEEEECTRVKTLLQSGSHPTSIGSKSTHLRGNKFLIKGKHGRYLVEMVNDEVSILGVGDRSDMTRFVKLMNNEYDVNLKYKI